MLADFYQSVTVVERDVLPTDPVPRRGVPQGRLIHALLAGGAQIFDELFPGLLGELVANGAIRWDGDYAKLWISFGGHRLLRSGRAPDPDSFPFYFQSRPFLEWHVLRRMRDVSNVTVLEHHDVQALTSTADRNRISGVEVVNRDSQHRMTVTSDLVVDATGRGSRTPVFLEQLGYDRPAENEVIVNLAYACQPVRVPPGSLQENFIAIFPEPGRPKMFAAVGYENDIAMFAVGAMAGLHPPGTAPEMQTFAADCAPAGALAAFAVAEPLGEVAHHRVPSNRWRRYDKLRRLPAGLIVLGDAICSFNPIYGQGMTVAAIEAIVLRDCLRRGDRDLPRRFFRSSAKKIRIAWQSATGSDLALPEVKGTVPLSMRLSNAYLDQVMTAAETDSTVMLRFLRVIGMIDSPARLLLPAFIFRVACVNQARRHRDPQLQPVRVAGVADGPTPVPERLSE
ncbi:FAD-dependent oxidoreductase [Mycolicibacterium gilvum]|uniref:FAD-dependent oxidoreductase n=1 Tax=Mycolicibacterium gilvum TaxID=1804 RepID=UPI0040467AF3